MVRWLKRERNEATVLNLSSVFSTELLSTTEDFNRTGISIRYDSSRSSISAVNRQVSCSEISIESSWRTLRLRNLRLSRDATQINSRHIQQLTGSHIPDTLSFPTPPSTHTSGTPSRSGPDDL